MATFADLTKLAASFAEPTTPERTVPDGWVYLGERNGKPHYRTTPGIAVPKAPINPVRELLSLPQEHSKHEAGGECPHCLGTGRYSAHLGHFTNERCYRCNGKGTLDARDLAFLRRRETKREPVCRIKSA